MVDALVPEALVRLGRGLFALLHVIVRLRSRVHQTPQHGVGLGFWRLLPSREGLSVMARRDPLGPYALAIGRLCHAWAEMEIAVSALFVLVAGMDADPAPDR